jgi:hypothetical protein
VVRTLLRYVNGADCVAHPAASAANRNQRFIEHCLEQATELAREVHGHARVYRALLVVEALGAAPREHAFVPYVRMDVEPASAVEAEAYEVLGLDVVAREREGHVERCLVEREEELAAVRVVVAVPQHHLRWRALMRVVGARGSLAYARM